MASYYDLQQSEREFWNVKGRLREIENNIPGGRTPEQDKRNTAVRDWLDARRREIEAAAKRDGWNKNNRRDRHAQLAPAKLDKAECQVMCELPSGNATDTEQAYIAERKAWWRVDTEGQDKLQKLKKQNYDWLVGRRKYIWQLAEGKVDGEQPGWDRANREQRYENLCVATRYGGPWDEWKKTHNVFTGEAKAPPDGGKTGRDAAVKNARSHLGTREKPLGSNRGTPQPSGWQKRVYGGDGVPWCACFTTCMAWDAGVKGSGSAGVIVCVDLARRGQGIYRGWTTDPSKVRKGDHAVVGSTSTHIEMVIDDNNARHTIGGNTSGSYNGSQANGDGVYERHRGADVVGWCLVRF